MHEVEPLIIVLVRDTAKQLEGTNDHLHGERAADSINAEVCDIPSKCSPTFTYCNSTTGTQPFPSGPIRLGLSVLPKADQDPHYSMNKRNESLASLLALPLV